MTPVPENRKSHESGQPTAASDDRCWINRGGFALDGKTHLTGAQIRAMPTPSIRDSDDLYMEVPGSEDLLVRYDEVVPVVGRRFFSVPSIINAGSSDAANEPEVEGEVPASWYLDLKVLHDRYRDALREIAEHDYLDGDECRRIANEALS